VPAEAVNPCRRESKHGGRGPIPNRGWRTGLASWGWSWANPVLIATPEPQRAAWRRLQVKRTSSP